MRPRRSSLILLALLATSTSAAAGQLAPLAPAQAPVAEGALFLLFPVGARAAALGQAAVADGGTSEAAFWNPAGLASMQHGEFALHHAATFASTNTVLAGYGVSKQIGVVGAAAYLVDYGTQEQRPGPGPAVGTFSSKNIELLASYATDVTRDLFVGLNYKLIQFRKECSADCGTFEPAVGTTHGVDVGMQYAFGTSDDLRIGVAVQHAGFKLQVNNRAQADPLPTRLQVGMVYRIHLARPVGLPQGLDARVLVDFRQMWGHYNHPDARIGLDVGMGDLVRLRTGYAFLEGEAGGPSIGVGLRAGRLSVDLGETFLTSDTFDQPVYLSLRAAL